MPSSDEPQGVQEKGVQSLRMKEGRRHVKSDGQSYDGLTQLSSLFTSFIRRNDDPLNSHSLLKFPILGLLHVLDRLHWICPTPLPHVQSSIVEYICDKRH